MKQKIVIRVDMRCGKCTKEVMKIAATADGVISVALQGKNEDEIVVIGKNVDSAGLCTSLRKKTRDATLLSVEEVKDPKPEEKKKKEEKKPEEKKPEKPEPEEKKETKKPETPTPTPTPTPQCQCYHQTCNCHQRPPPYYCQYPYQNPQYFMCTTLPDDNPQCTIM